MAATVSWPFANCPRPLWPKDCALGPLVPWALLPGVYSCIRRFCFYIIPTTSEKSEVTASGSLSATRAFESPDGHGCPESAARFVKNKDSWCGALCDTQGREYDTALRGKPDVGLHL